MGEGGSEGKWGGWQGGGWQGGRQGKLGGVVGRDSKWGRVVVRVSGGGW